MDLTGMQAHLDEYVIMRLRSAVEENPAMTVADLLQQVEAEHSPPPPSEFGSCTRCGRDVVAQGEFVTHLAADGSTKRGCRAASFTVDDGWDDSLPKTWSATLQ